MSNLNLIDGSRHSGDQVRQFNTPADVNPKSTPNPALCTLLPIRTGTTEAPLPQCPRHVIVASPFFAVTTGKPFTIHKKNSLFRPTPTTTFSTQADGRIREERKLPFLR